MTKPSKCEVRLGICFSLPKVALLSLTEHTDLLVQESVPHQETGNEWHVSNWQTILKSIYTPLDIFFFSVCFLCAPGLTPTSLHTQSYQQRKVMLTVTDIVAVIL